MTSELIANSCDKRVLASTVDSFDCDNQIFLLAHMATA
ncbi:hypothetical protein CORAM0001_0360 [Corynebacterium amycolatum SK46]|nr:hypothetical protein CORAM0001_0360 [Corynebacterium amycolatum SK46]